MSRGLRTALILVAIALFCCCVAGLGITLLGTSLIGRAFITNPDRIEAIGRQIVDYEMPAGYEEMFAMDMVGVKMVAIGTSSVGADFMMVVLMQFSPRMEISREEVERQVERALTRQIGLGNADWVKVGQEEMIINGEPVTMTVREGTTDYGEHLRQISGLFQGKGGPAMLIVTGESEAWDQAAVDSFVASIR